MKYGLALSLVFLGCVGLTRVARSDGNVDQPDHILVTRHRQFTIPLLFDRDRHQESDQVKVFVSRDESKTWKFIGATSPVSPRIRFTAPKDGSYWFGAQTITKDRGSFPEDLKSLRPSFKMIVDADGQGIVTKKAYYELKNEVADLRRRLEHLERKLAEGPGNADKP